MAKQVYLTKDEIYELFNSSDCVTEQKILNVETYQGNYVIFYLFE